MQAIQYFKTLDIVEKEEEEHTTPAFTPLFAEEVEEEDIVEDEEALESGWHPLFMPPPSKVAETDIVTNEIEQQDLEENNTVHEEKTVQTEKLEETVRETSPRPPPPPPTPKVDPEELKRIRENARQEGYKDGYASGEKAAKDAWNSKVVRLEDLLIAIGETREAIFQRVREDLVQILSAVPRKILRQVLSVETHAVKALVTSILEEIPRQERVVIKVSEDDLAFLEQAVPGIQRKLGGYTQIEIEASDEVTRGGAILLIEGGRIDATIERQLETFDQKAREWLLGASDTDIETVGVRL